MSTTIKLTLANAEVNRLFTRKLTETTLFYKAVMQKISSLLKRCQANQAYALLALHQIEKAIHDLTNQFYDEIDKFEGLLEKKKHLNGKAFQFKPDFYPEVAFDNSIAADLVELFEVYDKLISTLKVLRVARCFANDDDYFHNLRRYFKDINRLLSNIQLTKAGHLPDVNFDDVIDNSERYQRVMATYGELDCFVLYQALSSSLAPRLEEKIRQPLLHRLKSRIPLPAQEAEYESPVAEARGAA